MDKVLVLEVEGPDTKVDEETIELADTLLTLEVKELNPDVEEVLEFVDTPALEVKEVGPEVEEGIAELVDSFTAQDESFRYPLTASEYDTPATELASEAVAS